MHQNSTAISNKNLIFNSTSADMTKITGKNYVTQFYMKSQE